MEAWRQAGVLFRKRGRMDVWNPQFHEPHVKAVLNLGNLDMKFNSIPVPVFNPPELIRRISAPPALRNSLGEFLPPEGIRGPHWHKRGGFRGSGTEFHEGTQGICPIMPGDTQKHIEGDEFRVITVGEQVVQASKKSGTPPHFEFEWVGVQGVSQNGIIPLLHAATAALEGSSRAIIGWDVKVGSDKPYILEANTSPGVNDATANRIVAAVKELI
jgi:hypothetical protein